MRVVSIGFALMMTPSLAMALDRPDWAFPSETGTPAVAGPHDNGHPKQVPGIKKTYTQKEIDSINSPPDWFPDEHPPMPKVVANGNGPAVRACIGCHLANGQGHPENSR